mmetsp:Transcript_43611/g.131972  ORF Transcript_43611/g.131972 Transcript_43611/m.131972 type:complete len:259 (+) Transcript_43611:242-1018(+)
MFDHCVAGGCILCPFELPDESRRRRDADHRRGQGHGVLRERPDAAEHDRQHLVARLRRDGLHGRAQRHLHAPLLPGRDPAEHGRAAAGDGVEEGVLQVARRRRHPDHRAGGLVAPGQPIGRPAHRHPARLPGELQQVPPPAHGGDAARLGLQRALEQPPGPLLLAEIGGAHLRVGARVPLRRPRRPGLRPERPRRRPGRAGAGRKGRLAGHLEGCLPDPDHLRHGGELARGLGGCAPVHGRRGLPQRREEEIQGAGVA